MLLLLLVELLSIVILMVGSADDGIFGRHSTMNNWNWKTNRHTIGLLFPNFGIISHAQCCITGWRLSGWNTQTNETEWNVSRNGKHKNKNYPPKICDSQTNAHNFPLFSSHRNPIVESPNGTESCVSKRRKQPLGMNHAHIHTGGRLITQSLRNLNNLSTHIKRFHSNGDIS